MNEIIKKFKKNSLFFKLTLIMVISSVSISSITALIIMNISKNLFIDNFSIANSKSMNQIQLNTQALNDRLINVMNTINNSWTFRKFLTGSNYSSKDYFTLLYDLQESIKLSKPILENEDINFLVVGNNNSTYLLNSDLLTTNANDIKENQITKNSLKNPDNILYQYNNSGFTNTTQKGNFIISTKVLHDQTTKQQFGMLYMIIKENVFSKFYSNFTTTGNDILVMSTDGTIVSSSNEDIIGEKNTSILNIAQNITTNNLKSQSVNLDGKNYTVLAEYMPMYDFYLVNTIDTKLALEDMYDINEIVFACSAIISISILILFIITRRTINPLRILVKEMSKVTEGNLNHRVNLEGCYEIRKLSNSFNYMLDGLNDYLEKLLIAERNQRKSELSALQRQINPHFIYNTLACIKWLVLKGEKENASTTIDSFISLLQNIISDTSETITLSKEIENLKNYVFISETRYGDKIKVSFHVFPKCNDYKLPKLILQPFIENAFFHGFSENQEGHIHVFISEKNNKLLCEVADNGVGMDENQVLNLYSSTSSNHKHFTGIGIRNVDDRIKLLYGDEYGIKIHSKPGAGTTIIISLPLIR